MVQISKVLSEFQRGLHEFETKSMEAILHHGSDTNGKSLASLIKDGAYRTPMVKDKKFEDAVFNWVMTFFIGRSYMNERSYIIAADSDGDCASDTRGPQQVKVCLPQWPDKVFYIYFLGFEREGRRHQTVIQGPPGYANLDGMSKKYGSVKLDDIVAASYAKYLDYGNAPVDTVELATYMKPGSNIAKYGGPAAGAVAVSVCNNPGGEGISTILLEAGRNYPCMCGNFGWRKGYSPAIDETKAFLQANELFRSGDWYHYCKSHMDCKKDKSISWAFDGAKANKHIHQPFKRCKKPKAHIPQGAARPGARPVLD